MKIASDYFRVTECIVLPVELGKSRRSIALCATLWRKVIVNVYTKAIRTAEVNFARIIKIDVSYFLVLRSDVANCLSRKETEW